MKHIILIISLLFSAYLAQAQCSNPYAGPDESTCGVTYQLHATNTTTGTWTAFHNGYPITVTFINGTHPYYPVAWASIQAYSELYYDVDFVWTDNSGPCSDTVRIRFAREPSASVGAFDYDETCGNTYTFAADTTGAGWAYGTWVPYQISAYFDDINDPFATVTIDQGILADSAYVNARFIWTMNNYGCIAKDTMYVTFYQIPTANAGINDSVCGYEYTLHAYYGATPSENYTPSGWWQFHDGPGASNIMNQFNIEAYLTVSTWGTYRYVWHETNSLQPSCYSTDTVTIKFLEIPSIYAGNDFNVCGNTADLQGISSGFVGSWQNTPGTAFQNQMSPVTSITTSQYGPRMYIWQEADGMCNDRDTVMVTFYPHPNAEILSTPADFDTLACGLGYSLLMAEPANQGQSGHWLDASDPFTLFNASSQPDFDTVTVTQYGYHDFYWIVESMIGDEEPGFCIDTAGPFSVNFLEIPVANAGNDTVFCGNTGILTAVPSVGEGLWSVFAPITFISCGSPIATALCAVYNNPNYPYFEIFWTETNGICSDTDTIKVTFSFVVNTYLTDTIIAPSCSEVTPNLDVLSNDCEYIVNWSPTDGVNGPDTQNPIIMPLESTMYSAIITNLFSGCITTDSVFISVIPTDTLSLCMVTVNDDNKNLVVWEKPVSDIIDSFQIYRDNDGIFELLGSSPYDAPGEYADISSQPQSQSYSYKISALYECGQETGLSTAHKTILLTWEMLGTSVWHLMIDPYEGTDYAAVQIFRGTDPENLQWLTTLPADATEYTDNDAPTGSYVYYQAKIELSAPCNPAKSGNSILSNIATNDPGFYAVSPVEIPQFNVSPNPARNTVNISFTAPNARLSICDLNGNKLIVKNDFTGGEINIEHLKAGVYVVKLETEEGVGVRKLVVE